MKRILIGTVYLFIILHVVVSKHLDDRWSHHCSVSTCDDPYLKRAMADDSAVSFVFGLEVNWDLLQAKVAETREADELRKEEVRKALEELNRKRAARKGSRETNDFEEQDELCSALNHDELAEVLPTGVPKKKHKNSKATPKRDASAVVSARRAAVITIDDSESDAEMEIAFPTENVEIPQRKSAIVDDDDEFSRSEDSVSINPVEPVPSVGLELNANSLGIDLPNPVVISKKGKEASQNSVGGAESENSQSAWSCSRCTYENDADVMECGMCM